MPGTTLAEILRERSKLSGCGITFIESGGKEEFLSYGDLYHAALRALAFLQKRGMLPGDELVFQIDDNKTFLIIFWAGILGNIIPVPLSVGHNDQHREKPFNVWRLLNNPYLVCTGNAFPKMGELAASRRMEDLYAHMSERHMDAGEILSSQQEGKVPGSNENDIAFLQFSSGSTGQPKGVILTHGNLVANMRAISLAAGYSSADSMLSWMPLTHDMGLIGFHLNPLYCGMQQHLMPVSHFIRRPAGWLDHASRHGISILSSPNFGYSYLMRHLDPSKKQDWNLSRVRIIYNGAEAISERTAREFLDRFAEYGLPPNAICPVYGLAEATLAVSMSDWQKEIKCLELDRNQLKIGEVILAAARGHHAITFVNVGQPVRDCLITIVDEQQVPLAEGFIGHVLIKGAGITAGYYQDEAATTAARNREGWWDTGDIGFMKDECLFITGRFKDLICINGQNFYPHDLERIVEEAGLVELNKIVVGGSFNTDLQKEEIIAFVFFRESLEKFMPLAAAVKTLVNSKAGIEIGRIVPVKDIPRTTSGKLQRFKLLEQYNQGDFRAIERQLADLNPGQVAEEDNTGEEVRGPNLTEHRLLGIIRAILRNNGVGLDDDFFAAGGNSLKTAELAMMVWKEFQVELPLQTVYEYSPIRRLAGRITALNANPYVPIARTAVQDGLPLSSAQKRLYYQWQMDKTATAYNIPVLFSIKAKTGEEKLDEEKLRAAIQQLMHRHEILRTSFHGADNRPDEGPIAQIDEQVDFSLERLFGPATRDFIRPFDLGVPPLFRAGIIHNGDEQCLLLDFHHIIADGLSIHLFMQQLATLYAGGELPEPAVQYKDYACWETAGGPSKMIGEQEAYWQRQFEGEWPILQLPADNSRLPLFSTEGGKMEFEWSQDAILRLKKLAGTAGCTLHALLLTVYNVLLSKYTAQKDLVIGIPAAGRRHPDLQDMQGMFVNNLPIRTRIEEADTFTGLLERIADKVRTALDHQDFPFELMMGRAGKERDSSRNSVFDTMFIYQNMGPAVIDMAGLTLTRRFLDPGISKYDLSMEIFEEDNSLKYALEYASALFNKETILRMAGHFDHLIAQVIENPHQQVSQLNMMPEKEYDEYIHGFNATDFGYPKEKTVFELFAEQASIRPDNIAVEFRQRLMTYHELNEKACRFAALLKYNGIGPGSRVAVLLPRSPGLVIAILGILKAGACYLPIDTGLPQERIDYLLSAGRCNAIIIPMTAPSTQPFLFTMEDEDLAAFYLQQDPAQDPAPAADLAYIIYTSGTTGRPKGVMIGHRALVNYITWAAAAYNKGMAADYPLFTSISFDLTVTSLFTPLITGGRIIIYGDEKNELLIEKVMLDNKSDIIKLTPGHLKLILASPALAMAPAGKTKIFIVGGEDLETRVAGDIYRKFGNKVKIYNEYGPTEATVGCMIHEFDPAAQLSSVPIGTPAANTQIYLLDEYLQPVTTGVPGEMYIAGDGLAEGYFENGELTEAKFLPNPFHQDKKMYKTGDVAKRQPNGGLLYVGRADRQYKLNGYRVEPAEIESQLLSNEHISEAVVTIKLNGEQKKLYAYYTSVKPAADPAALRDYLAARLPHYMIPAQFIRLEKIPLTRNGKIDYDALPQPELHPETGPIVAPKNSIEEISLRIWEEVMGEPNLSLADNFFHLGGDSIKAFQIISRLAKEGISLDIRDILTYHTLGAISLRAKRITNGNTYEQGILQGQRGLLPIESWFFSRNFKNPGHYNQSILLRLHGNIRKDMLDEAFNRLIEHHDGLRTNYDFEKKLLFCNNRHLNQRFTLGEYVAAPSTDGSSLVISGLKKDFDLAGDLLLRAALVEDPRKESGNARLLLITAHHLVIDGVSWRILLEDLYHTCMALQNGDSVTLPRKTATVADFLQALKDQAIPAILTGEMERNEFCIPQDFRTPDWKTGAKDKTTAKLSAEDTEFLLKEANRNYKTDTAVLLNTALGLTLREWTQQDTLIIEQESFGRQLEGVDTSRTIGWFTTMYPLRLTLKEDSLANQIRSVKEQMRRTHNTGYGPTGHPGTDQLTEIRFNYLGQFDREFTNDFFSYDDRTTGGDTDPGNAMTARLEINTMAIGGELRIEINYNTTAHKASTISWFKNEFLDNIQRILHHIRSEAGYHLDASDFDAVRLDDAELDVLFE